MSTRARNQRVASFANKVCGSIFSQGTQSQGSQSLSILQSRIPTSKGKKKSLTASVDSNNNQDVWKTFTPMKQIDCRNVTDVPLNFVYLACPK